MAKSVNEGLTTYDALMDESPQVNDLLSIYSMLENGVYPQVSRVIEPIALHTKSPRVTYESLKILLQAQDDNSAEILSRLLDHKVDYDTQKIAAIAEAVSHVEDMSPHILGIVERFYQEKLPQKLHETRKTSLELMSLGKVGSSLTKSLNNDNESRSIIAQTFRAARNHTNAIKALAESQGINLDEIDEQEASQQDYASGNDLSAPD